MRRRLGLAPTLGLALAALIGPTSPAPARAADPKPLAIGAPAPDFDLPGVDGKSHKLADYAGSKALVVVFTCNDIATATTEAPCVFTHVQVAGDL